MVKFIQTYFCIYAREQKRKKRKWFDQLIKENLNINIVVFYARKMLKIL